jgi:hypothetical protein
MIDEGDCGAIGGMKIVSMPYFELILISRHRRVEVHEAIC